MAQEKVASLWQTYKDDTTTRNDGMQISHYDGAFYKDHKGL
ncbi:Hypothetical protein EAG7_00516 [Klebsiella aerogenes]|nr:Hypothetical protein EAG7_00516 [Klebsiella aerogenes]CCG29140.1 hypothetical protein [Klebsiella aerogenes EA1509E]